MGGSCCHAESPCGSAEERSGLLKDDSRVTVPTGGADVVGTCGPQVDDVVRLPPDEGNIKVEVKADVKVKHSPEGGETAPRNTQENGVLQEAVTQTAAASPRKVSEVQENSARAQDADVKDRPADAGHAGPLLCALNPPPKENTAAELQVVAATNTAAAAAEEENKTSPQGKILDISPLTAEAARPENHTEPNAAGEPVTPVTTRDTQEEADSKVPLDSAAAAEPSGETSENNEVSSVANTQLAAACQVSPIAAVGQEISKESAGCGVTGGSESPAERKEAGAEALRSHDVPERPAGSEPAGLGGEEQDSANCVPEPETTAPADASASPKSGLDPEPGPERAPAGSKEVASLEKQDVVEETMLKGQDKDEDVPKVEENNEAKEEAAGAPTDARAGRDAEMEEKTGDEEPPAGSASAGVKADERSAAEREDSAEDGLGNSEEDLYRGPEELSPSEGNRPGPPPASETTLLKVEDRRSLAPAIDILSYSEREWKGNTAKSALIRKGYKEMSQRFGSLRRVRGDNYCALRATLFQVLSHSPQLPEWLQEDDITMLPKQLEAQEGLISQWMFPGECLQGDGTGDAILQLKGYVELLREKWRAAVCCPSASERRQLCERLFQGGEEELGLLEALKLLMLGRAAELHGCMRAGGDVPLFCWLLFARDSSDCPRSFLSNHLSHVGLSAGLEQVEMFLLGYALQCTIQVYRLYKADTEEFVTYYPDDHKDDWPSVCLVTEDDRHYNVPIVEAAEPKELHASS